MEAIESIGRNECGVGTNGGIVQGSESVLGEGCFSGPAVSMRLSYPIWATLFELRRFAFLL